MNISFLWTKLKEKNPDIHLFSPVMFCYTWEMILLRVTYLVTFCCWQSYATNTCQHKMTCLSLFFFFEFFSWWLLFQLLFNTTIMLTLVNDSNNNIVSSSKIIISVLKWEHMVECTKWFEKNGMWDIWYKYDISKWER